MCCSIAYNTICWHQTPWYLARLYGKIYNRILTLQSTSIGFSWTSVSLCLFHCTCFYQKWHFGKVPVRRLVINKLGTVVWQSIWCRNLTSHFCTLWQMHSTPNPNAVTRRTGSDTKMGIVVLSVNAQMALMPRSKPGSPTLDQSVYHARTQVWKTPPIRGFWTKKNPTPFSAEIAEFEALFKQNAVLFSLYKIKYPFLLKW